MSAQEGDVDVEMEDTSEPLMQPVEVSNDHMDGEFRQDYPALLRTRIQFLRREE